MNDPIGKFLTDKLMKTIKKQMADILPLLVMRESNTTYVHTKSGHWTYSNNNYSIFLKFKKYE